MKKVLIVIFTIILVLTSFVLPVYANPAEDANYWIYDSTDMISDETVEYINDMNARFNEQEGQPKFAIVFTENLPEKDLDAYMNALFQEYGMSYNDDSCDVLIYIAINDKKYHIEHGGAYNQDDAFLMNQDLQVCMFGEEVEAMLYAEEYDDAVITITKFFEQMMEKRSSGYYVEAEARRKRNTLVLGIIFAVAITAVLTYSVVKIVKDEKKKKQDAETTNSATNQKEVPVNEV